MADVSTVGWKRRASWGVGAGGKFEASCGVYACVRFVPAGFVFRNPDPVDPVVE